MVKRIELSESQLESVIQLRQRRGYSWLRIERETHIPRRVAKREYLRWEQQQAREDLQTARREVAAEEFREHLDALLDLAVEFAILL